MSYQTQNELLLGKLLNYYNDQNNLEKMLSIINGESKKKEFYDNLFDKLFSISEYDLLKKEEINHPISKS